MFDGLTLATLVPLGSILPAAIATFFIGLGAGGLAQRELDRALRRIVVRRAVQDTVKAMRAGTLTALPDSQTEGIPGMPYRRAG
jgi:hypothetical protein